MARRTDGERKRVQNELVSLRVRYPLASYQKLADTLNKADITGGKQLDGATAKKYLDEVWEERAKGMNTIALAEVAKFESDLNYLIDKLTSRVEEKNEADNSLEDREMRLMVKEIANLRHMIFQIKFDTGVFKKQLGELEINTKADLLKALKENGTMDTRGIKTNSEGD